MVERIAKQLILNLVFTAWTILQVARLNVSSTSATLIAKRFWHSDADFIDIPIAHDQYANLSRYGKTRFSATLLLSRS